MHGFHVCFNGGRQVTFSALSCSDDGRWLTFEREDGPPIIFQKRLVLFWDSMGETDTLDPLDGLGDEQHPHSGASSPPLLLQR